MTSARASDRAFLAAAALLFVASAAATTVWCASMATMGGMPMPGGWVMSMTWMPICGRSWPAAAASFIGMWAPMMAAMMLPSLMPMLQRYRRVQGHVGEARLACLTILAALGYFLVWTAVGMAAFPLGVALAAAEMRLPAVARAVPLATGLVVLLAGALQLTAWKARQLACCRGALGCVHELRADAASALRHGLRLGLHCSRCCAGATAALLALGVMDLRAMALATAAITAERLTPAGDRVARAIGALAIAAGFFLVARAAGLS